MAASWSLVAEFMFAWRALANASNCARVIAVLQLLILGSEAAVAALGRAGEVSHRPTMVITGVSGLMGELSGVGCEAWAASLDRAVSVGTGAACPNATEASSKTGK